MPLLTDDYSKPFRFKGDSFDVNTDFKTVLKLFDLFEDETLKPETKEWVFINLVFKNPEDVKRLDLDEFVILYMWEVCGLDCKGDKHHEKQVIDFKQDAERIYASFYADYGIDLFTEQLDWRQFTALLSGLSHETPIMQAVYYRTCKIPKPQIIKGKTINAEEIKAVKEAKAFYALKAQGKQAKDVMERQSKALDDMAASIRKASQNGA